MKWTPAILLIAVLISAGMARPAVAHVGPPFPLLVDQPVPGYVASVWADPDVGEALFYVMLEPTGPIDSNPPPAVSMWVQPVSGRLPKVAYSALLEPARGHVRYVLKPEFDQAEFWNVGIEIQLPDGTTHPLAARVEATPPGLGPWDLLLYLLPFVLFGGLWGLAFLRRTRQTRSRGNRPPDGLSSPIPLVTLPRGP